MTSSERDGAMDVPMSDSGTSQMTNTDAEMRSTNVSTTAADSMMAGLAGSETASETAAPRKGSLAKNPDEQVVCMAG